MLTKNTIVVVTITLIPSYSSHPLRISNGKPQKIFNNKHHQPTKRQESNTFCMIYKILGFVFILQQVCCCFKCKLEMMEVLMVPLQGLEIIKKTIKFGHPNGQLKKQKFTHHMKIIGEGKVGVELGPHLIRKIMACKSEKTIVSY